MSLILAIDQGTTSTRAIAFEVRDHDLRPVAVSQIELAQHFPAPAGSSMTRAKSGPPPSRPAAKWCARRAGSTGSQPWA